MLEITYGDAQGVRAITKASISHGHFCRQCCISLVLSSLMRTEAPPSVHFLDMLLTAGDIFLLEKHLGKNLSALSNYGVIF